MMILADIKSEILKRGDANYFNQTEYLERAETLFFSTLYEIIKSGEYEEREIFGLIARADITLAGQISFFDQVYLQGTATPIHIITIRAKSPEAPQEQPIDQALYIYPTDLETLETMRQNNLVLLTKRELYYALEGRYILFAWKGYPSVATYPVPSITVIFARLLSGYDDNTDIEEYLQLGFIDRIITVAGVKLMNEITRSE